ncbi:hypothetical protein [Patiriisocius marinus]|uniref:DUF3137 domain-containing protein n=1 Tax=Patiriisocius marinus TaxID=1397112 RepID=A0A5J4J5J4_9FLAO|nr:hypothetical protein [Patiriisocius marinus]GER59737.1 hypothetical protein ULMA_18450 [Patiriisocius marinus]
MKRAFFKNLAKTEGGEFYFKDKDILSGHGLGVRSPNVTYLVKFNYKDHNFSVMNSTGNSFVGIITCNFSSTLKVTDFKIDTISHFKNLFLRRKSRFKITAKNENIKSFLLANKSFIKLELIAKKGAFDPLIVCEFNESKSISTKYHLEFDDWTDVVEPIIELYKNLIDEFEKGVLNISNISYQKTM